MGRSSYPPGVATYEIELDTLAVAITKAADTLTRSLAIELAPITFDGSPTGRWPTQITLSHRRRAARVQPGTSRDVPRGATSAGLCASFSLLHEAVATRRPDTRPLRTTSDSADRGWVASLSCCNFAGGSGSRWWSVEFTLGGV